MRNKVESRSHAIKGKKLSLELFKIGWIDEDDCFCSRISEVTIPNRPFSNKITLLSDRKKESKQTRTHYSCNRKKKTIKKKSNWWSLPIKIWAFHAWKMIRKIIGRIELEKFVVVDCSEIVIQIVSSLTAGIHSYSRCNFYFSFSELKLILGWTQRNS